MSARRTLDAARGGSRNLRFRDVRHLVEALGSRLPELAEARGQCKPYQVRQVLQLMDRYNLTVDAE